MQHGLNSAGHSGRATEGVGFSRFGILIVGSNPARGMDVCPRLSVLCCPVEAETLKRVDPRPGSPTKCGIY
jgi:hypothetical protein